MKVIPKPQKTEYTSGSFYLDENTVVCSENFSESFPIIFLTDYIKERLVTTLRISAVDAKSSICFKHKCMGGKPQSYVIEICENQITIFAEDGCGFYYGAVTLCQLIDEYGVSIPCCKITDYCSIEKRGILYDATRGRVPKLETVKELIKNLSFYKINQLYFYIEHTFEYAGISEGWRGSDAFSARDFLEIIDYAQKYYVEVVPTFASFGHLYQILGSKSYSHLAEMDDVTNPYSWIDRQIHHVVDVSNPQSEELIFSMLEQTLPLFKSQYFNLGCDETFDLGMGRSKSLADKYGKGELYGTFVSKLCEKVKASNKKPMVFGDIMEHYPELTQKYFKDATILLWHYGTDGLEEGIKKFESEGNEIFLCCGTSGWNRFICDYQLAEDNIYLLCKQCAEHKLKGIINTDWGDMGSMNFPEIAEAMYIYGAQYSWNIDAENDDSKISEEIYGDAEVVDLLKQLHQCEVFNWADINAWNEEKSGNKFKETDMIGLWINQDYMDKQNPDDIEAAYTNAVCIKRILRKKAAAQEKFRYKYEFLINAAEAISLSAAFLSVIRITQFGNSGSFLKNPAELAEAFEYWLSSYEKLWRMYYKESELRRIQETVFSVCDTLRDIDSGGR